MFLNNKILLVVTKTERILLFGTSSCLNFSKNNDMHDKCDSYLIRSEMFPVPRSTSSHSCLVQYVNIANYAFSWAIELNPRTYTQSHTIPPPALGFLICTFDLLYKVRYILWVVALLEVCYVTNMVAILDFVKNYKQVKTVRIHHFLCLTCKITQK